MKTRYEAALMKKAHGMPNAAIAAAARAGPLARAMLNVIELSAIADPRSRRETSEETIACCAGAENALTTPSSSANTITVVAPAWSVSASTPRVALSTTAELCVTSSSRRRSKRSAALPDHGASTSTGMNVAKFRTPSRNAEPVTRYRSRDAARFWNHVPLAESALPTK